MTRNDILRWANQCRFFIDAEDFVMPREGDYALRLARFATLVAAHVAAHEREACAKVCEQLEPRHRMDGEWLAGWSDGTDDCADAIRARAAA